MSDPPATFTQTGEDTWQSSKDVGQNYWPYIPGGMGDILYNGESGTYTAFDIPASLLPVQAAEISLYGALDDHFPGTPAPCLVFNPGGSPNPRKVQLLINGVPVVAESTWTWGSPYWGPFTTLSWWTTTVDPALLAESNTVVVSHDDPRGIYSEDWITFDRINLTVTRWPANATVDVDPDTLNTKSKGVNSVTVYAELPAGYAASDLVSASLIVSFGQSLQPVSVGAQTDLDGDGCVEVAFKFDRQALIALAPGGDLPLTFTASFADGTRFSGSDTIRVIHAD